MVLIDYHRLSMIEIGGFGDDHHIQFNGDGQPNTTHIWHKPVVTQTGGDGHTSQPVWNSGDVLFHVKNIYALILHHFDSIYQN